MFLILWVATLYALYCAACCGLAFWAGIGRTSIWLRMPTFLVGLALLASVPSAYSGASEYLLYVFISVCLAALMVSTLRWFDVRLLSITDGIERSVFDAATGRSIDEWFRMIEDAGGASWNHADTMRYLGDKELDQSWAKRITDAFQVLKGRRLAEKTSAGDLLYVDTSARVSMKRLSKISQQRASLRDMAVGIFCVACVAAILRQLDMTNASYSGISISLVVGSIMGIICIGSSFAALGISMKRTRVLLVAFVATGIVTALSGAVLGKTYSLMVLFAFGITWLSSIGTLFLLNIVRQYGFRLVFLSRKNVSTQVHG